MNYIIRKSEQGDYEAILQMIKDLAEFEKLPEKVINTVEYMKNEQNYFTCFVVEDENREIIGMALCFFAYFTWVGKSLYLDDLYVKPEFRRMGIGTALLHEVFALAKSENCRRLRWQVLNWNTSAISLYRKCGAFIDNEWSNCDFEVDQIACF